MLSVRISYNAKSRVLDLVSVSNGDETLPIGTTNDDLETRLDLEFVDPDGAYSTYGRWCDFGVLIPNETKTRYLHPRMRFKEDNTLDIPYGIIHYAKTGVLPIQLTLISETTELSSVNSVRLKVTQAIEAEDVSIVIPDQVNVVRAVDDVTFESAGPQYTLHRLDGSSESKPLNSFINDIFGSAAFRDIGLEAGNVVTLDESGRLPSSIVPDSSTIEHFECENAWQLTSLSAAKNGDTAKVVSTMQWFVLNGEYSNIDDWIQVNFTDGAFSKSVNDRFIAVNTELAKKTDKDMAIPEWSASVQYHIGSTVVIDRDRYEGDRYLTEKVAYISNSENVGSKPSDSNPDWRIMYGTPAHVEIIGNGSRKYFVKHPFNTFFVFVQVITNDEDHRLVDVEICASSLDTVTLRFNTPVTDKAMIVLIKPAV